MHVRRSERGFTLIELMIVVAIIALLAGIAVPAFMGESKKSRARGETAAIMSELAVREDQWRLENGSYMSAAACPTAPAVGGQDPSPCLAPATPWNQMRVRIQETKLFCSYSIVAGVGTGTGAPVAGLVFASPAGPWFYILAQCDMDNKPAVDSYYFMTSIDSAIQKVNEGR